MLHAVIMAGGSGTRFWPASREATPKQLLDLTGGGTMIAATAARLGELAPLERVLILTNERLVAAMRRELPDLPAASILGEPCKRDTAPCIGLAAGLLLARDGDATMVVMPADHIIATDEQFQAALRHAVRLVDERPERIVTFGIRPTYPAASFGYIQRGAAVELADGPPTFAVEQFREKPSVEVAQQYLNAGGFYWNAGIFVWKARTVYDALAEFEPEMHGRLATIVAAAGQGDFAAVLAREFAAIRGKSIDYAVMERYRPVLVVEAPFTWDDVGSWQALARLAGADDDGNTIVGRHVGVRTRGAIVRTTADHLVATLGVDDLIVVHTPDATLVANKHDEEAIRELVQRLKELGWSEFL